MTVHSRRDCAEGPNWSLRPHDSRVRTKKKTKSPQKVCGGHVHSVDSVAVKLKHQKAQFQKALPRHCAFRKDPESKLFFSKVDFDFLLDGATVINPLPDNGAEDFESFMKKPRKTF
uniref:40S ribosomal protein S19-binding protein 1 n=1 Tax=Steinernema glaseri TaxID=37863 RepID=A0A1I7Y354_9BILA